MAVGGAGVVVVIGVAVLAWAIANAGGTHPLEDASVLSTASAPTPESILSEKQAFEIALREADLKGMPESDSLVLSLKQAGDLGLSSVAPVRPVWLATATGRFFPFEGEEDGVITEYHRIEIIIDGFDTTVVSLQLADATYITPLPVSLAGGATPQPTFTPMPAPSRARLLTEEEVRARFEANGDIDQDTLWLDLRPAGEIRPPVGPLAADYPIWIVRAEGTFHPNRGGPRGDANHLVFTRMMVFIDAVTGMTIGTSLSGQADSSPALTP
jgi:hypothetical protein